MKKKLLQLSYPTITVLNMKLNDLNSPTGTSQVICYSRECMFFEILFHRAWIKVSKWNSIRSELWIFLLFVISPFIRSNVSVKLNFRDVDLTVTCYIVVSTCNACYIIFSPLRAFNCESSSLRNANTFVFYSNRFLFFRYEKAKNSNIFPVI